MIYGLDLSLTGTGLAKLYEARHLELMTLGTPALMRVEERLATLAERIREETKEPGLVVIEGLAFSRNDPSAQARGALHFIVRCNLWAAERSFLIVTPNQAKKFVTGKGSAEKSIMLREIHRRWGVVAGNDNEGDAAALAYVGLAFRGGLEGLTVPMKEVVSKLKEVK